jgi:hypothetical protein
MPVYLYRFGFESPRQFRNNLAHGWDDEDSQAFLIEAPDEAAALAWGQAISERFLRLLFRDESVSWRERRYAYWVEAPDDSWQDQPAVVVGEFPDFGPWIAPYRGEN